MKPLGMDKNRVLVYEGDIVLYGGYEYKAYMSDLTGNLLLIPYIKGVITSGTLGWIDTVPGAVEVVNVSDRTNYERYFADLCEGDDIYKYLCKGIKCCECIINESLCNEDFSLEEWVEQPAVKL